MAASFATIIEQREHEWSNKLAAPNASLNGTLEIDMCKIIKNKILNIVTMQQKHLFARVFFHFVRRAQFWWFWSRTAPTVDLHEHRFDLAHLFSLFVSPSFQTFSIWKSRLFHFDSLPLVACYTSLFNALYVHAWMYNATSEREEEGKQMHTRTQ